VIRRDVARLQTILRERAMGLVRGETATAAPAKKTGARKASRRSTAR
jgi:hypothetical protein